MKKIIATALLFATTVANAFVIINELPTLPMEKDDGSNNVIVTWRGDGRIELPPILASNTYTCLSSDPACVDQDTLQVRPFTIERKGRPFEGFDCVNVHANPESTVEIIKLDNPKDGYDFECRVSG